MYKILKMVKFDNTECNGVVRMSDYAVIPEDDTTGLWQEYLDWVNKGNDSGIWKGKE